MTNEEYARQILSDIDKYSLDVSLVVESIKLNMRNELQSREYLIQKELTAIRWEILKISKV